MCVRDVARLGRYDPPMTRGVRRFAILHLTAAVLATLPLLWYSDSLPFVQLAGGSIAIVAVLWVTGVVMQGRTSVARGCAMDAAALVVLVFAVAMVAEPQSAPKLMPIWNRNVSRLENRPSSEPTTGRFGD